MGRVSFRMLKLLKVSRLPCDVFVLAPLSPLCIKNRHRDHCTHTSRVARVNVLNLFVFMTYTRNTFTEIYRRRENLCTEKSTHNFVLAFMLSAVVIRFLA